MTIDTDSQTMGQRINAARTDAGLSLAKLGSACGVAYQAVQQWEKDSTIPDAEHFPALDTALKQELGTAGKWVYYHPRVAATLMELVKPATPGYRRGLSTIRAICSLPAAFPALSAAAA